MAHVKQLTEAGWPLDKASKAIIMIHGRGASASDILSLSREFPIEEFYIVAPQATNFTWYPYSLRPGIFTRRGLTRMPNIVIPPGKPSWEV